MSTHPNFSVIIPAHNEEAVIERCLKAIQKDAHPGELDIIVVCNACSDRTAQVASQCGASVRVIESPVPSKTNALNLGDAAAQYFPRFYLDADVVVDIETLRHMAEELKKNHTLAIAPEFKVNLSGSSCAVKAFYKICTQLPSASSGVGGACIYGVSELGRKKFSAFPNLIADDTFFRLQFADHEWKTLTGFYSTVFAPKDFASLVRIKSRSYFGSEELRHKLPELWKLRHPGSNRSALLKLCLRPSLWADLFCYGCVRVMARLRVHFAFLSGLKRWERDNSSRN